MEINWMEMDKLPQMNKWVHTIFGGFVAKCVRSKFLLRTRNHEILITVIKFTHEMNGDLLNNSRAVGKLCVTELYEHNS